jgi:AcrR family transcriptional regulator
MSTPTTDPPRGRRLAPEARKQQILDAARTLFAERRYTSVSTADVAEAAGVARSLVHHYFGGIRELLLAIIADAAAALAETRTAGPETPLEERLQHNVSAGLDVIAANRETWLAVVVYGGSVDDPDIRALLNAGFEQQVARTLAINSDVISDTPTTRRALRAFNAFATEATRAWVMGECTREDTERLLTTTFRHLLLETIPELERRT